MISVICGLGAALLWATSTVSSARSTRMLGPHSVVAWVLGLGLLLALPLAAVGGIPEHLRSAMPALLVSAACGVVGFLLTYAALEEGKVSLVAPIVSAEGAVAAVIAVIAGESLSAPSAAALGAIVLGVVLASLQHGPRTEGARHPLRGVSLAVAAALVFGISLYASGRASHDVPAIWVTFSSRLLGAAVVLTPLALRGKLRLSRAALPFVALSAACEVIGYTTYVVGARHSVAITAVTASQFAAVAALGGVVFFRERLARVQLGGVAVIIVAVGVLSAINT